jgi:hypothetical protein
MLRVALAFVVAPFPAAFLQSLVVALWPKPGMGVFEHPASMFVAVCIFFYFFGLILGVPVAIFLRKKGYHTVRAYALTGLAVILTPILAPLGVTVARGGVTFYAAGYNLAFFALGGLMAGALFWLVSRPDRRNSRARQLPGVFE